MVNIDLDLHLDLDLNLDLNLDQDLDLDIGVDLELDIKNHLIPFKTFQLELDSKVLSLVSIII